MNFRSLDDYLTFIEIDKFAFPNFVDFQFNSIQFNTDLLPMSTDSKDNQCKDTTVL